MAKKVRPDATFSNECYDAGSDTVTPHSPQTIIRHLGRVSGGWPRRVNESLFVVSPGGEVTMLDRPSRLFGWMQSLGTTYWSKDVGRVTKEEFWAELTRTASRYDTVEEFPHEPPRREVYYTREWAAGSDDSCKTWFAFRDMFSPATQTDADLITALFCTGLWGGGGGRRPAFIISSDDGPGTGKSTLARMLGYLFGGILEFSYKEDIHVIKQRLLSPLAQTKRIVLIDNVKDNRVNWADLECLVTSPIISGKRMFQGEGTRPNLITWIITLNGISLSSDLAQRSIVLKLRKNQYRSGFDEECYRYIDEHRTEMIGDLIHILRRPVPVVQNLSRWGTWECEVLGKIVQDTEQFVREIGQRQVSADDDAEEAELLRDEIRRELQIGGHNPYTEAVRMPVKLVTEWASGAWKMRMPTQAMSRRIRQMMKHGSLKELSEVASRTWGRCLVWSVEPVVKDTRIVNYLPWQAEIQG